MKHPNFYATFPLLILSRLVPTVLAWGGNNNDNEDASMYGMSMQRSDWLYGSSSIGIKVEGCVWGYVEDRENMGCMEDESEDGTTLWYMMANCRRAQVAYSVYATSSGSSSCQNKDFKETLITKNGLAEFAYTLGTYGYYSPITEDDVEDLPLCEQDEDGYYLSVGCSSSGSFTVDRFTDAYCLQHYDTSYSLDTVNTAMKSLSSCYSCYDSNVDADVYSSLCAYLIPYSGSCSALDSPVCTTNSFVSQAGSSKSLSIGSNRITGSMNLSLSNKLKYGLGGAMLIGSAAMFIGILVTNRRKRRAMMHRKFRQSSEKKRRSKSRSKSKSSSSRTRSSRRSSRDHGSRGGIYA
mmetsp:Transcript_13437/g.19227  ORF Transcript_13437/g.19227 Transcript_13437/m.19227 type:complete len:351 (-) Transcript_13437:447-1499(-)|eukprot:CAMPEP_0184860248 /NCGR_PEP_ID=MMETSP0580-20130426/5174_1 /TAXON_ID=1118495 /ORGANISM="Dactyliosolen fragilissimus" /LENGTH=350 /DNA_ID=CAMNT_0027357287 /DNA_START=87 /DNA_END=1139 /DNA_ORIENTATION=-